MVVRGLLNSYKSSGHISVPFGHSNVLYLILPDVLKSKQWLIAAVSLEYYLQLCFLQNQILLHFHRTKHVYEVHINSIKHTYCRHYYPPTWALGLLCNFQFSLNLLYTVLKFLAIEISSRKDSINVWMCSTGSCFIGIAVICFYNLCH